MTSLYHPPPPPTNSTADRVVSKTAADDHDAAKPLQGYRYLFVEHLINKDLIRCGVVLTVEVVTRQRTARSGELLVLNKTLVQ